MSSLDNLKEISKLAKNQTFQLIFAGILIAIMSFLGGKFSVDVPVKDVLCKDIIADNKKLSTQVSEERVSCELSKESVFKDMKQDFESLCADRVSTAIDSCDFNEDIHCPICVARGVCKW